MNKIKVLIPFGGGGGGISSFLGIEIFLFFGGFGFLKK
jgi:hypothetical protein